MAGRRRRLRKEDENSYRRELGKPAASNQNCPQVLKRKTTVVAEALGQTYMGHWLWKWAACERRWRAEAAAKVQEDRGQKKEGRKNEAQMRKVLEKGDH